jgi:beta-galactosidase/beta-glucuronidase
MYRTYHIDIKRHIKKGKNQLTVLLESPIKKGLELYNALDYIIPVSANDQAETGEVPDGKRVSTHTRKAGYHYGWDWGPRLVTSGIWRPITISSWETFRITNLNTNYLSSWKDITRQNNKHNFDFIELIDDGEAHTKKKERGRGRSFITKTQQ